MSVQAFGSAQAVMASRYGKPLSCISKKTSLRGIGRGRNIGIVRAPENRDFTMTARDAMLGRLRGRNPETALEREFYSSQEDYQVDLDMIW